MCVSVCLCVCVCRNGTKRKAILAVTEKDNDNGGSKKACLGQSLTIPACRESYSSFQLREKKFLSHFLWWADIACVCVHTHMCYLCPTFCNTMNCSPPGSLVHLIFQAHILEWVAISYSRRSSWPSDQTSVFCVSCTADRFLTTAPPEHILPQTLT